MFVEGTISEVASFRDAFVKWEKETVSKWKTCQWKKSAVESRWVRCREEIGSRKMQGFCARTESLRQQRAGFGKCREGAVRAEVVV